MPLSRRFGYAVINIYLPSLIMAIVGYLTLFFLTNNFEVRVMTALTSLLVLATISNQVRERYSEGSLGTLFLVKLLGFMQTMTYLLIHYYVYLYVKPIRYTGNGKLSSVF